MRETHWKRELQTRGAAGFARWLREQPQLLFTDTRIGDAGLRLSAADLASLAPRYACAPRDLLSLECWGGPAFEAALLAHEDPWERLALLRQCLPGPLLQMPLSGIGALRREAVPDNVLRHVVRQASAGIDLFRIHDGFDRLDQMRLAMDETQRCGALCEVTIHPRGDDVDRCLDLARRAERAGAHSLGLRDTRGCLGPAASARLVRAIREAVSLPLRFHSPLPPCIGAAAEAGADLVDLLPGMDAAISGPVDAWWQASGLDPSPQPLPADVIRLGIDRLLGDSAPHEPLDTILDELAQHLCRQGLDAGRLADAQPATLPPSFIALLCGEYGYPAGGFSHSLRERLTRGHTTLIGRPGLSLPLADLRQERQRARQACGREPDERELASWLLFPQAMAATTSSSESPEPAHAENT